MRILFVLGSLGPTSVPGDWAKALSDRGHSVRCIETSDRSLGALLIQLRREVRRMDPDVIHCHHSLPALLVPAVRAMTSQPIVLTVHRVMSAMDRIAFASHRVGIAWASAVVGASDATMRSFPRRRKRHYLKIYNGVDVDLISTYSSKRKYDQVESLVSVGRLIPEKGFDVLLEAMALLRQNHPRLRLTIVGGGPDADRLQALARRLGINRSVTFLGRVDRLEVYSQVARADAFVLFSRTEGFCNAVVEAMASGAPVLVSAAGALPEVVADTGWVVSSLAPSAVAEAISGMLTAPPSVRRERGQAAAHRARTTFSIDGTVDNYEALYRALTRERAGETG